MMEFESGNSYKLVYLDTNAINEIAKNTNECGKNFLNKYANGSYMFCTSTFNLYELSKTKNTSREHITDIFGKIPLAIISLFPQLIEFEKVSSTFKNEMIMFTMGLKPVFQIQIKDILDSIENDEKFTSSIEIMNKNIEQEIEYCNKKDRIKTIWTERFEENLLNGMNESLSIYYDSMTIDELGKYRSLEILAYIKNQFTYCKSKDIGRNSIIDAYNTSIVPYVDEYITERTVGSWLEMAKNHFDYIKDIEIVKISSLYS